MATDADLQDLIDNPSETMSQELKDWQDISSNVVRANLARHIAALSNHGGGYILVGFNDNEQETAPNLVDPNSYTRDAINGIVEKYLLPPIHCDIAMVVSTSSGIPHPVIWVPGHQAVPICSRAGGPQDEKGRSQGIQQATYYIRKPGPKSEPITSPDSWRDLIRRCIVSERESLLRDISTVLAGRPPPGKQATAPGTEWHDRSHERFREVLHQSRNFHWPVEYSSNHYQLSYRIIRSADERIEPGDLVQTLERANQEIREFVWTGWSMFYPFSRDEIRPYFVQDVVEGMEIDVLETNLIDQEAQSTTLPDFWRFCGLGYASIVRAYREDRHVVRDSETNLRPGEWFSPHTLIREISEFLRHAVIISRAFESAQGVEFNGRWVGLANRRIDEFDSGIDWRNRVARADTRTVQGEWSVAELAADWENVVATLASPICRLFDGLEVTGDWVRSDSRKFRQL
jgi:hypothetical protein